MCIWYLINTSVLYFFRLCRLLRSVKRTFCVTPAKKKKCLLKCCGLLVLAYQTWSTGLFIPVKERNVLCSDEHVS